MAKTVTVIGFDELSKNLTQMVDTVTGKALRKATADGGRVFQKAVKDKTPVRAEDGLKGHMIRKTRSGKVIEGRPPGYLKKHIAMKVVLQSSDKSASATVGPTRSAFYGRFVELGTSHAPAHPFMRPAFDANTKQAEAAFQKSLTEQIAKFLK